MRSSIGQARVWSLISRLKKRYPGSKATLTHDDPFQLLVATILSAQCTDIISDKVARELFKTYKGIRAFAYAHPGKLSRQIYSTGFYRQKSKSIIACAKMILREYNGKVPDYISALVRLPGVGRKTANIVLSGGFRKAEGIAVDTHVKRISARLGLTGHKDPDKIEQDLLAIVPRTQWLGFNYLLVTHGRQTCRAIRPRCCECPIARYCPSRVSRR